MVCTSCTKPVISDQTKELAFFEKLVDFGRSSSKYEQWSHSYIAQEYVYWRAIVNCQNTLGHRYHPAEAGSKKPAWLEKQSCGNSLGLPIDSVEPKVQSLE